jgi:hypothetical protein
MKGVVVRCFVPKFLWGFAFNDHIQHYDNIRGIRFGPSLTVSLDFSATALPI